MRSFLDLLPPARRATLERARDAHAVAVARLAALDDAALVYELAATLDAIEDARRWRPGDIVYNAAVYHVQLPELVARLTGLPAAPLIAVPTAHPEHLGEAQAAHAALTPPALLARVRQYLDQVPGAHRGGYAAHVPGEGTLFHGLIPELLRRVARRCGVPDDVSAAPDTF